MFTKTVKQMGKLKPVNKTINWNSVFLKRQLRIGTKIEMEHTTNKKMAETIAKHHLGEHPPQSFRYYIEMKKMEKKLFKRIFK